MQSIEILVWRIRQLGFELDVVADKVNVNGPPRRRLPKLLREELEAVEQQVVEYLGKVAQSKPVTASRPATCPGCRGDDFWLSGYGSVVCGKCHPPASPSLVVKHL